MNKTVFGFAFLFLIQAAGFAQEKAGAAATSSSLFYNSLFIGLLIVIILLLVVIVVLADVLKAAAYHKKEEEKKKKQPTGIQTLVVIGLMLATSGSLSAQNAAPQFVEQSSYCGLGNSHAIAGYRRTQTAESGCKSKNFRKAAFFYRKNECFGSN